jgi:hypothetical protein
MAQQDRTTLKTFFETGDFPTEAQFGALIDSEFNIEDDFQSGWFKASFNFAAFQPNATPVGELPFFTLNANSLPIMLKLKHTTAWTGGPITSTTGSLQNSGNLNVYLVQTGIHLAPANDIGSFGTGTSNTIPDQANPQIITIGISTLNGVIDDLTQGDIDCWILPMQLP